ncbi:MAG: N-6 DNA methylase [Chloroflexi bacterium]|nr:N-6 DNA methylase [Chloroflexota bacterium]
MSAKTTATIKQFYEKRKQLEAQGVKNELSVREAFKELLATAAESKKWTLVVEQRVAGTRNIPDGTLRDGMTIPRGYWEAKDSADDLEAEIARKLGKGYPASNIIFENSQRAVLIQSGQRAGEFDLERPDDVHTLLDRFLGYTEPNIVGFEAAVEKFRQDTPRLAEGLRELIRTAHKTNRAFITAYATFYALCQTALNPNLSKDAVDEMLIQHLLTERLMRTVFDNPDFAYNNAIAREIETVIRALASKSFSREQFIGQLTYFYEAIEAAAHTLRGFSEKQAFINTVYERFFQGFAVKVADTHGIVYTPQPIVDFMCAAVEEVLRDEFNLSLADDGVCIIDPCTGTGNFIVNLLRRIHRADPARLETVYRERLFANEVMLMPYYIAALNIEHEYLALTGNYAPFEGLCFVDTLDLAEGAQLRLDFMTEKNTERVQRQKAAPITVIIGNPPYNVGQLNENDNNKNRKYEVIDKRLRDTYSRDSKASSKSKLNDPYVKFFRWAADRLQGRDGVVCYVSNNGFVDGVAFDGFRKHLLQDFSCVYHLDLKGDAHSNGETRRREGGNVFHNMIRVGVGITVAVRSSKHKKHVLRFYSVPDYWRAEQKLAYLREHVEYDGTHNALNNVSWETPTPGKNETWRVAENSDTFNLYIPLGDKETKRARGREPQTLFKTYSLGLNTNRDQWAYDFDRDNLIQKIQSMIETYNAELDRWRRAKKPTNIDAFVTVDERRIKWSSRLKETLKREQYADFETAKLRSALYRPYTAQHVFFDTILNHRRGVLPSIFPLSTSENVVIIVGGYGRKDFSVLISSSIPDLNFYADPAQCFPFYVYDEDGTNRRENITDWALAQFHAHYADDTITKWDIFYYVYGLLHHPGYRQRYADNLKRELPRLPFAPNQARTSPPAPLLEARGAESASPSPLGEGFRVRLDQTESGFWTFAQAGRVLADLHLHYETVAPYALEYQWAKNKPISYRVEKMRLTKDKTALVVNPALTLAGIPAAAFDYKLGNRSALDWVIDQYQVKTDVRSGITSDPNRYSDDEKYIVELVGRVVAVSVATAHLVAELSAYSFS